MPPAPIDRLALCIVGPGITAGGVLLGLGGNASVVTHLMQLAARELEADAAARHAGGLLGALPWVALACFAVRSGWRRLLPTGDDARVGVRSRITWIGVAAALALLVVGGRVNADREHAQRRVAPAELQRTPAVVRHADSGLPAPDIGGSTPSRSSRRSSGWRHTRGRGRRATASSRSDGRPISTSSTHASPASRT